MADDHNEATELKAPIEDPKEPATPTGGDGVDEISLRYEFALDILSRRYELYGWCETKMQILATVDSILLAAVALVVGVHGQTTALWRLILTGITFLFLGLSLGFILWHVIPTMNSKVGNERIVGVREGNPRSTIVINKFATKEQYSAYVGTLGLEEMMRYNLDQIYGMNKNIMTNQRAIRIAVFTTYLALASFACLLIGDRFHV